VRRRLIATVQQRRLQNWRWSGRSGASQISQSMADCTTP